MEKMLKTRRLKTLLENTGCYWSIMDFWWGWYVAPWTW